MKKKRRPLQALDKRPSVVRRLVIIFVVILVAFFGVIIYTIYSAPKFQAILSYAKVPDAELAYYTRGRGEPIILITGFGMTMQHWDPVFLEQLAAKNKVIVFDYRAVGASSGDATKVSQQQMVDDVTLLMDELQIDKAHILGWSLGSFVAQGVAEQYPDRVDQLILLATNPGGDQIVPAPEALSQKVQKDLAGSWEEFYAPLMFSDQKNTKAYLERVKNAQMASEVPKTKGESTQAKVAHQFAFADVEREKTRYEALPSIKARTLLITGEDDQLTNPENAKRVEKRIPTADLHIIADSGHAVMFEKSEEVTRLVKDFLKD